MSSPSDGPIIIVLAGPNGAGKSTAARESLTPDIPFVNADEVAKTLPNYPSPSANLASGRLTLEKMERLVRDRADFAVETTLSGRTLAGRIARMRRGGYSFRLVYFWVPSPDLSIQRVASRARSGGHDILEDTIRRRYVAGLRNLVKLYVPLADSWAVYDNSSAGARRIIASGDRDDPIRVGRPELWARILEAADDA